MLYSFVLKTLFDHWNTFCVDTLKGTHLIWEPETSIIIPGFFNIN